MRVIIAAGGTGGHLYPGVALAREFARVEPGSEAIFVGTVRGLETKVVPREGFELITITAQGVMGRGVWGALQGLAAVPVGLLECLAICRRRRPDLAIGLGGYTSPPLMLAAFLLGVKRSEEHTSELQSRLHLVCRLLLEKKNKTTGSTTLLGM